MKIKIKLQFILLIFCSFTSIAQNISGQILNEFDKTPIFGVTIYSNNLPLTYSDQDGIFFIEDASNITELTFYHFAFEVEKIEINSINNKYKILLKEKINSLNEIVLIGTNKLNVKEILKKSTENYKKNQKQNPYLTNINAKQIVMQNNDFLGYVEMDGILYNFISQDNNPFRYPFFLPKKFKKTAEKTTITDYLIKNKRPFNIINIELFRSSFLELQFANVSHPLTKNHKYTYKQLDDVEINGIECFNIQFFQKKGINVKRELFNVYGEMIISKEDFSLIKHNVSFDFDIITSNEIEILYEKKDDKILPKNIKIETKIINPKYNKKGTFVQTYLSIDNSNVLETTDITNQFTFNLNYYFDELEFDSNYWNKKTTNSSTDLIDNYLKSIKPIDFLKGAEQKVLDKDSKNYNKDHENFRLEQIKLHQEIIKNIKL